MIVSTPSGLNPYYPALLTEAITLFGAGLCWGMEKASATLGLSFAPQERRQTDTSLQSRSDRLSGMHLDGYDEAGVFRRGDLGRSGPRDGAMPRVIRENSLESEASSTGAAVRRQRGALSSVVGEGFDGPAERRMGSAREAGQEGGGDGESGQDREVSLLSMTGTPALILVRQFLQIGAGELDADASEKVRPVSGQVTSYYIPHGRPGPTPKRVKTSARR